MFKGLTAIFLAAALAACSAERPVSSGSWQLNGSQSDIVFISVKNGDVAEISRFGELSGAVSADGLAELTVQAASVESYIDIRNERLRDIFFEVSQYPQITVTAQLNPAAFEDLAVGAATSIELPLTVSLHGEARTVYAPVRVTRSAADQVVVTSSEPALVDARDFGLGDAVDALAEIANLNGITPVFPVSAHLVFERR
ncbi:YceI family protein [Hyphobacterium sp.]|jgi:polyisoprenoid-binding protein YceI|uniref:YceI family protein n=1 Tax=Hyphobacterium sp. TaxID=2004662 RepID=UPI003BABF1BD